MEAEKCMHACMYWAIPVQYVCVCLYVCVYTKSNGILFN